ncbi:MAG: MoaD/ThiS family protein [Desulfomonilaceae bacterium]
MPIYIELGSYLRRFVSSYDPRHGISLEYRRGMTIADLLAALRVPDARSAIITVNRTLVGLDYQLEEGDRVGIFPAAWGG